MANYIVKLLEALPKKVAAMSKEYREIGDAALKAVNEALNETQLYYSRLEKGVGTQRNDEEKLVKLWAAAAIPMRHIDEEFAEICQYKSQFWLEPSSWSIDKVREFRIELNSVQERYIRKLRKESFINKK
ncbi:hypothetical protein [Methylophilus sp. 14]|uniref:hypothetical protein n=1 Tax=Methylophilus sp. 14 TaxID=2781019 RepID=UPI00188E305C|nr:hypothetical protein [Methylophilus sp. 14]MBF4987926.1 hypothetical protein [Methylophilus sp. 14]